MPDVAPRAIAITRPRQDATKMAAEYESRGIKVFIIPMLEIEQLADAATSLESLSANGIQAICITSRHAIPLLSQQKHFLHIPLYTVGEATAQAAEKAGFTRCQVAGGTGESLLEKMRECCLPQKGEILYARGRNITLDLASELRSDNYKVHEAVLYAAHEANSLSGEYISALKAGDIGEVQFFSERSAANYVRLMQQEKLEPFHTTVNASAISKKISSKAAFLPWKCNRLFLAGD